MYLEQPVKYYNFVGKGRRFHPVGIFACEESSIVRAGLAKLIPMVACFGHVIIISNVAIKNMRMLFVVFCYYDVLRSSVVILWELGECLRVCSCFCLSDWK